LSIAYGCHIAVIGCASILVLITNRQPRGGLLHDFFLYDWHVKNQRKGLHGFTHPRVALENAIEHFDLNDTEKDIIEKHMWPLTIRLPKTKESLVVSLVDKYCSLLEIAKIQRKLKFLDLTY